MDADSDAEIRNLISRMAWLTDKWNTPEEYLANCTHDFSWQIEGMPPYIGHGGMGRRLKEMRDLGVCGPGLPTRHCVTSTEVIAKDLDDQAKARSFIIMMTFASGVPIVAGYGEYHDDVRREKGRWLLAKRYSVAFWQAPKSS
jgi:hypothetical protein